MSEPIAYLKGNYVPISECKLAIYDLGIVLGAGVTDLIRTFNGKPFRVEDHVKRFYRSCKYARIEPPVGIAESIEISNTLIAKNSALLTDGEVALVYYITPGENAVYAGAAGLVSTPEPTYVQHVFPLRFDLWREYYTKGVCCVAAVPRHWPPECLSSKIKSRNRLHMWIGDWEVHQADPKLIAVYLDIDGNITETSGSNIAIYRDGAVISPTRKNILWGISLTVVQELLEDLHIPFREEDIQPFDIMSSDEVWLTTTPYCLAPVVKMNGVEIGNGKPGPLWLKLIGKWSNMVGKDIYHEVTGEYKNKSFKVV